MNRNKFFKTLFTGAAAVVVAPKVIAEALEEVKKPLPRGKIAKVFYNDEAASVSKATDVSGWFEEPRLHFKIKVKVANSDKGTIRVMLPKDHKFRLQDVVMVGSVTYNELPDATYLVTDVSSIKFYDALNDIHGETIGLTAYSMENIPSAGEEVLLMLVGNDYIGGTDA